MDKQLRDLAFSIVKTQSVNKDQINSLIGSLSTDELRKLLNYLKLAHKSNLITVTIADDDKNIKDYIARQFPDKKITYHVDDKIGGGVIVKIGDDVYDYSVKNYINTTINRLSEEL